jgi:hypothetical protein
MKRGDFPTLVYAPQNLTKYIFSQQTHPDRALHGAMHRVVINCDRKGGAQGGSPIATR